MSESEQVVRQFLRKWSTIELEEDARRVLKEDARRLIAYLEVLEAETVLIEEAEHAPDREWFAAKYQELFVDE